MLPLPLETPALLVDRARMERNLARMATYAAAHGLALRPHAKTHKTPQVAAAQLRHGAVGLACATPREMEVMSEVASDLLFAYPPVGRERIRRLLELPGAVRLAVALDSAAAVEELATEAREHGRAVDVLVEVDLGMHRVGVPDATEAVALARLVAERAPLAYRGIAFYPGHIRQPVGGQHAALATLARDLAAVLQTLERAGLPARVVSGGSTPAAWHMHELPGLTEVRPGTYVYNDRTTATLGACDWDDCALTVLATVVSTAIAGQVVIDAGSKTLGREPLPAGTGTGFGALLDHPDVVVRAMSEEHGLLDVAPGGWQPRVGDQVRVVPNHVCVVVHAADVVHVLDADGEITARWPVAARGRLPG